MDINDLRGLSTALLLFAFIGLCLWAYSSKRKEEFERAANLPFIDEPDEKLNKHQDSESGNKNHV